MARKHWTERQRQRWGERVKERLLQCTVISFLSKGHPSVCTAVCSSGSQRDAFVDGLVLHTGDHQAGKHPSSKITPPHTHPPESLLNQPPPRIGLFALDMQEGKAPAGFMQRKKTRVVSQAGDSTPLRRKRSTKKTRGSVWCTVKKGVILLSQNGPPWLPQRH